MQVKLCLLKFSRLSNITFWTKIAKIEVSSIKVFTSHVSKIIILTNILIHHIDIKLELIQGHKLFIQQRIIRIRGTNILLKLNLVFSILQRLILIQLWFNEIFTILIQPWFKIGPCQNLIKVFNLRLKGLSTVAQPFIQLTLRSYILQINQQSSLTLLLILDLV